MKDSPIFGSFNCGLPHLTTIDFVVFLCFSSSNLGYLETSEKKEKGLVLQWDLGSFVLFASSSVTYSN